MAVLFDTHAFHRTLTDASVLPEVAKAHRRALELALDGGVATKQGVQAVGREVSALRQELKQDIELLARDLKIWFGGVLVVVVGPALGAAKLLWN